MEVRCIKATKSLTQPGKLGENKRVLNVAAYCRVSTDEPDQKKSYESQISYFRQKINNHEGWRLVDIYADLAMTGTQTENRPELRRMMEACRAGEIDLIETKSISRFSRNTYETLKYVRELKELNIAIEFEEDGINTLTMDGELILTVLCANYQQEVENISSHVKMGLRMKMERGELVGYSACLGYDYDKEHKQLIVNEKEAEIVRYIFRRYLEGVGSPKIAKELQAMQVKTKRGSSQWSGSTVNNIIKNEKYVGDILQGKTFIVNPISKKRKTNKGEMDRFHKMGTHTAIISRQDFELAQEIRTNRGAVHTSKEAGAITRFGRQYAFSHMIECGACGEKFVRRSWHKGKTYSKCVWQCGKSVREGKKACPRSITVSEKELERIFIESFNKISGDYYRGTNELFEELMTEVIKKQEDGVALSELNGKINSVEKKIDKLVSLRVDGDIVEEDYRKQYNKLRTQIDGLKNKKSSLELRMRSALSPMQRLNNMKIFIANNKKLIEFDRKIFETVVSKVAIGVKKGKGIDNIARIHYIHGVVDDVVISGTGKDENSSCRNAPDESMTVCENQAGYETRGGLTEVQYRSLSAMLANGAIDEKMYGEISEKLKSINRVTSGFAGG